MGTVTCAARFGRGILLAAACVFVPAAAHAQAGGTVSHAPLALLALLLIAVVCVALADRRREPYEIAGVLTLAQPAVHLALADGHTTATGSPWAMVLAHGLAVGVLTVLLAGAERVYWVLCHALAALLPRVRVQLATPVAAARAVPTPVRGPRSLLLAAAEPPRGPPRACVSAPA